MSKQGLKELLLPTLDDAHIKKSEHSSINTSKFSSRVLRDMSNEVMI